MTSIPILHNAIEIELEAIRFLAIPTNWVAPGTLVHLEGFVYGSPAMVEQLVRGDDRRINCPTDAEGWE